MGTMTGTAEDSAALGAIDAAMIANATLAVSRAASEAVAALELEANRAAAALGRMGEAFAAAGSDVRALREACAGMDLSLGRCWAKHATYGQCLLDDGHPRGALVRHLSAWAGGVKAWW